MSKIIKPGSIRRSQDVVSIPDYDPAPVYDEEEGTEMRGMVRDEVYESMLRQAREGSEALSVRILERTKEERGQILERARGEAEEIREQARREGFEHGVLEKADEIENCIQSVLTCLERLRADHERFADAYCGEMQQFAADIAEKILLEKIEADDMALAKLVRQAVHSIRDVDWISVEVSERLPALVRYLETEYAKKETETRLEASGEDIPIGSCILQTSLGRVDASVSAQIANLKELFRDMSDAEQEG